jgi:starvation-inducible DNA-binding protein
MQAMQNLTSFENNEKPIIDLLDRHLASAIDLQLRLRSALWNLKDARLAETRELDTTASEIEQFCNLIAERLRALGAAVQATPQRVQVRSFLDPYPPAGAGDEDYISAIERALAKLRHSARQARERAAAFCDETTATLFARLASAIDRQIWFLRSPSSESGERG